MPIRYEDLSNEVRRISLSGRLDTVGSEEIADELASLAGIREARRRRRPFAGDVPFVDGHSRADRGAPRRGRPTAAAWCCWSTAATSS